MSRKPENDWDANEVLDDVDVLAHEAQEFKELVDGGPEVSGSEELVASPGAVLKGKIIDLTKDYVAVDVGLKSEGLISVSEFYDPSELRVGGEIEVLLEQTEDEKGQIVLSRQKARKQRQWEYILRNCSEGSIVKGLVLRRVKGGLMVDIGVEAFLPGSQVDNKRVKELDPFVGKTFEFKILKINQERQNVVISRRELLEAERIQKRGEMLETIQEGALRTGVVKNITDFGVFLDLDGIDVLLHITDMSWKRVRHPSEMVKIGDTLEVMILSIDHERGRVAVGLKQREKSPWEEIEDRYPVGTKVTGRVTNTTSYGAFMEIEPGIEGLVHVSEMSWSAVADPSKIVSRGEFRDAVVLAINKEEGKISLSMKQLERNPWENVETNYPVGSVLKAEIRSLTSYGAFVELEPGLEGLIHISSIGGGKRVNHPSEVLRKGASVECVVLFVDKESRKITLGLKDGEGGGSQSDEDLGALYALGQLVEGVVTKLSSFGAFLDLEKGGEGLIHINELSDRPIGRVEDAVELGERLVARVIRLDLDSRKVHLSLRGLEPAERMAHSSAHLQGG
ncbi:30S ribosomal protein S1 [Candidatus Similichlamydia laticola]|uniref:30S ribosomal protein S1 n=1 Tax=Candidatus Similichlamydia laticola TaxID=2170265 RepID=A0A369KDB5_9BACT|nr:30S ribosomal protein S1 [Candidatus Similichlamydia laticola]RDB31450.1 SSU ribosomal protein S1p [Candidatus Similichlamydia laticola]